MRVTATAEYQRARRDKLAKAGLCRSCGCVDPSRRPAPGYRSCHVCIARAVERKDRDRRGVTAGGDSFCVDCCAHGFHRDGCRKERSDAA